MNYSEGGGPVNSVVRQAKFHYCNKMLEDKLIRLCGLKFKRQCDLDWDKLDPGNSDREKNCKICNRTVYLCETDEETMDHADQGHCVARAIPNISEVPLVVFGEPDAEWLRANQQNPKLREAAKRYNREQAINDALDNLTFTSRRCESCGYPFPSWWKCCRVCGSTVFRDIDDVVPS